MEWSEVERGGGSESFGEGANGLQISRVVSPTSTVFSSSFLDDRILETVVMWNVDFT